MFSKIYSYTLATTMLLTACTLGAQTLIIGGATGNGDFELEATPDTAGAQWFSDTENWLNLSGSEGINFTQNSGMPGHPDNAETEVNYRGGMLVPARVIANNTGYTVQEANKVLDVKLNISRHGNPATWATQNDEYVNVFLFTTATLDGDTNVGDISVVATASYTILTEPFWQMDIPEESIYTTLQEDVGKILYMGMELVTPSGSAVYPRIDNVEYTASDPLPTWNDFVIEPDGVSVDTGDLFGWVDIRYAPWIWIQDLQSYSYIEENLDSNGGWVFLPKE